MRRSKVLFALISTSLFAQEALNEGIAAFKNGHYKEAVAFFQQEVAVHPDSVNAHLYLGTAYMSQWVPGAPSPENAANARAAEKAFRRVLELDANNTVAIASMASLAYNEAGPLPPDEKSRKLDEAMNWYKRLAAADPTNKEAFYSMGVIAWAKWYPALMAERATLRMRPEDPGPLPAPFREELKAKYSALIEEGLANLDHALELDPRYDDAMAYKNLLIRERGDLRDTKEEWAADKAVADQWVQKTLDTKKAKAGSAGIAAGSGGGSREPIRYAMQTLTPASKVEPVYPPLAMQARIEGMVRFVVRIGKDGSLQNIQLVSGHPLLVESALDAVKQYVYNPIVVNGEPREAITQVDIHFVLKN